MSQFANEGRYEEIAQKAAEVAESIISEYRDCPIFGEPMFHESSKHSQRIFRCRERIKLNLSANAKDDFRITIIALLDEANEILKRQGSEISSFYGRLKEAKKKTKETGARSGQVRTPDDKTGDKEARAVYGTASHSSMHPPASRPLPE